VLGLGLGDVAGRAHDGLHVDTVGDDELEQAVREDLPGVGDGDRPDAGNLTGLTRPGTTVEE
jgi:hypothetical protein